MIPTFATGCYEWDNYRLVCGRLNGRKGDHQDVLDPCEIVDETFALDFPSLLVKPGRAADTAELKAAVQVTIRRLGLNDEETSVRARWTYVRDFCKDDITFRYLETKAPFIAMELKRRASDGLLQIDGSRTSFRWNLRGSESLGLTERTETKGDLPVAGILHR